MTEIPADFDFRIERYHGVRIIVGVYPREINVSKLSTTISRYYDLWDEDEPTASINDLRHLEGFAEETKPILLSVIRRTMLQRNFIGSGWCTGDNQTIRQQLVDVLHSAGRTDRSVLASEIDAFEYVYRMIDRWLEQREARAPAPGAAADVTPGT